MRFTNRLLAISAAAVLVSGIAAFAYAYRLADPGRDALALERIEAQLAEAAAAVRSGDTGAAFPLGQAMRELARLRAFRQDRAVEGLRGAMGFFCLQTFALLCALAAAAVFLSKGLASLRRGIGQANRVGAAYRFVPEGAPDFREIAGELNRMLATIERQDADLREAATLAGWKEVASFLGHQLKNPLSAIAMAAANAGEALERDDVAPPLKQRLVAECVAIAADESARMKALVARFRSLTAFEAPRFAPADLVGLLRDALARRGPAFAVGKVVGPERLVVSGDAELLAQAFANLVDNAVEAAGGLDGAPPPAGPVRLLARVEAVDGPSGAGAAEIVPAAVIAFSDSNTGVDSGLAERLGRERFSTKRTGSGLGLLFVRRIAAIHGGDLTVALNPAGGLEFTIHLGAAQEGGPA